MPKEYVAESLLEALAGTIWRASASCCRVRPWLATWCRSNSPRRGAIVDVVEAYRTVIPEDAAARAREVLARKPHWITFTSSSTVKNFVAAIGGAPLEGIKIASIGPITSATARELGLTVDVEADPHTVPGVRSFSSRYIVLFWFPVRISLDFFEGKICRRRRFLLAPRPKTRPGFPGGFQ